MKKVLLSLALLLVLSTTASAFDWSGFGISARTGLVKGGNSYESNINATLPSAAPWRFKSSSNADKANSNYGFDIFYEAKGLFGLSEKSILGIKIGYLNYSDNSFDVLVRESFDIGATWDMEASKLTSEAFAIPINVYYAYQANKSWKFLGGFGVSVISNKFTGYYKNSTYTTATQSSVVNFENTNSKNVTAIAPNINAGIELSIIKYVGLFIDLGYQFSAKLEDGSVYRDLTGLTFNAGVKIYPFK